MFTVSPSGHFFLVFLANNVAREKFLKEKNKIGAAWMRIIFRMHRLQAHTWHSALLRKQHCCLPSPSGAERDTPSVIFMLLSLSICLKSRTDSSPPLPLRLFVFASEILAVSAMWQPQVWLSKLACFRVYYLCPPGCHSRYSVPAAQALSRWFWWPAVRISNKDLMVWVKPLIDLCPVQ